jgi:hypothetical protein
MCLAVDLGVWGRIWFSFGGWLGHRDRVRHHFHAPEQAAIVKLFRRSKGVRAAGHSVLIGAVFAGLCTADCASY